MFCDVCGASMEPFTIIAWDLCPDCIQTVRGFLREEQQRREPERKASVPNSKSDFGVPA